MGERLQGKVAIVVGAGQSPGETIGNGRACAILFAREGARVMVVDNRLESARETQALIEKEGGQAFSFQADVTSEGEVARIPAACLDKWSRIDILHNNVGMGERGKGLMEMPQAEWQRFLDVNLLGAYLGCKHVVPRMIEQGSGVVINTSSIASLISMRALAYKASKAGVDALTRGLAIEVAPYGVRVNAILPGLMETPMAIEGRMRAWGVSREEVVAPRNAQVPLLGRMGTGWDVGHAAVFLASDEARFITGVLLPVDGGQSARIG